MGRSGFGMGIGVVLVVVDSNDKYTKRRNVSNHEHLQINHKILPSSAQTPNAMCAARYAE